MRTQPHISPFEVPLSHPVGQMPTLPMQVVRSSMRGFVHIPLKEHATAISRPSPCTAKGRSFIRFQSSAAALERQIREPTRLDFVPPPGFGAEEEGARTLFDFIRSCGSRGIVMLTGAGLSTESGIPDYRSPKGSFSMGHKPVQHREFVGCADKRKRCVRAGDVYAADGHNSMSCRNSGHQAVAQLESLGVVSAVVTQNVDALHQKAGSRRVIDLHGRNDMVKCLGCHSSMSRSDFHSDFLEPLNPAWAPAETPVATSSLRPDGDAAVEADFSSFKVPCCPECGAGTLKPDVVFFGDSVPEAQRVAVQDLFMGAAGIIVAGSSLWTPLPFRLVEAVRKKGIPVAILNVGATRACSRGLDVLKIEERCGPVLSRVAAALSATRNR